MAHNPDGYEPFLTQKFVKKMVFRTILPYRPRPLTRSYFFYAILLKILNTSIKYAHIVITFDVLIKTVIVSFGMTHLTEYSTIG